MDLPLLHGNLTHPGFQGEDGFSHRYWKWQASSQVTNYSGARPLECLSPGLMSRYKHQLVADSSFTKAPFGASLMSVIRLTKQTTHALHSKAFLQGEL